MNNHHQQTFLVITDHFPIIHWVKKNVEPRYFTIYANTTDDITKILQSTNVDFILLDAQFSENDSLPLVKKLRLLAPSTCIILITDKLKHTFRKMARSAGVSDFINDELSLEALELCVAENQKIKNTKKKIASLSEDLKNRPHPSPEKLEPEKFLDSETLQFISDLSQSESASLLMLRIDHFSKITQTFPELMIDSLLQFVKERLHSLLGPQDRILTNVKGLYIVFLSNLTATAAKDWAHHAGKIIQDTPFLIANQTIHLTISSAIFPCIPGKQKKIHQITASVFRALKEAKERENIVISLE